MFPCWLKQLFPKKSRPAPRRRRPARVLLALEHLEAREVPAVSAVVSGGQLVVSTNTPNDTVSIDHKLTTAGPFTFVNGTAIADSRITRDIHILSGFQTVNILATAKALNFDGHAFFMNLGKAGSMQGITAPVSLGTDNVVSMDDSADPNNQVVTVNDVSGSVTVAGLARFETISFNDSGNVELDIRGGSGVNIFTIFNTPNGVSFNETRINTGTGKDIVDVLATSATSLRIDGQAGGSDTVNIGTNGSLQGIQGEVDVNSLPSTSGKSTMRVFVDGSADNKLNPAGVFMGQVFSTNPSLFSIVGMSPGNRRIQYDAASTSFLQVKGEKATDFQVDDTMPNGTTELDTNAGLTGTVLVEVAATHGPLTLNSLSGAANIIIGDRRSRLGGSLVNIQGAIHIFNTPNFSTVTIDESADNRNHSFHLFTSGSQGVIDGLGFVAPIFYNPGDIHSITLTGGHGSEGFLVESTVGNFPITINAPGSSATFIVGFSTGTLDNIHNPLTLHGGAGFDTLLVADQNAATGHFYSDDHVSQITRDFGAVTVNYSLMNTEQLIQSPKPNPGFVPDPFFPQATNLALTDSIRTGQRATLTGQLVDSDPREVLSLTVNWGDGSQPEQRTPNRAPFRLTHRYDTPGTYKVRVLWTDSFGRSNFQDLTITVRPARHDGDGDHDDHGSRNDDLDAFFAALAGALEDRHHRN
jgi:hypothetical protein